MAAAGISSPAELARRVGVADTQVSRWRRGTPPNIPHLRKLSRALGIPFLELMIAAGHIEPAEAKLKDVPQPPEPRVLSADEAIDREFGKYPEIAEDLKGTLRTLRRKYGIEGDGPVKSNTTRAQA